MSTERTGSGDSGYTDLLGRRRVPKYHLIPDALGEVDEATSALGLAKAQLPRGEGHDLARQLIEQSQHDLYQLMAELAFPPDHSLARRVSDADVQRVDAAIAQVQAAVTLPNKFILPGACPESAGIDLARAVVRRAERTVVRVLHAGTGELGDAAPPADAMGRDAYPSNPALAAYLNRLSLLLYVLARYEDALTGATRSLAGE